MDGKKPNNGVVNKLGTFVTLLNQFVSNLTKNKLKGKNLLTLIIAVLAFVIVVSVIAVKCSSSNEASQKETDNSSIVLDDNTNTDENSNLNNTEDSQALSINSDKPQTDKPQTDKAQNESSDDSVAPDNEVPFESDNNSQTQTESQTGVTSNAGSYVMYCGKFSSSNAAEEKKANIAISTGLSSKIISKGSFYSVLLGPFNTREEAVKTFNKLDSLKLIDECDLEEQN
ncbi:MAG: SPOR domain-containing protein [Succinivibrio sp.]|jgi:cell division protein FtsN|nr:SPOR domain-containing protein [Succinivibrio sp.]